MARGVRAVAVIDAQRTERRRARSAGFRASRVSGCGRGAWRQLDRRQRERTQHARRRGLLGQPADAEAHAAPADGGEAVTTAKRDRQQRAAGDEQRIGDRGRMVSARSAEHAQPEQRLRPQAAQRLPANGTAWSSRACPAQPTARPNSRPAEKQRVAEPHDRRQQQEEHRLDQRRWRRSAARRRRRGAAAAAPARRSTVAIFGANHIDQHDHANSAMPGIGADEVGRRARERERQRAEHQQADPGRRAEEHQDREERADSG